MLAICLLAGAPSAPAATSCWREPVDDWLTDGRIDRTYADSCYAHALRRLPTDLAEYSSLADEIRIARVAAARARLQPAEAESRDVTPVPSTPEDPPGPTPSAARRSIRAETATRAAGVPTAGLVSEIAPRKAEDVPIPLLALVSLATLLLASGAARTVARRTQHRRPRA
jgi:hypothetical protein